MLFSKLALAASLFTSALAAPAEAPETSVKLSKRAEGVHLVNCGNNYSAVVYCSNDSNCNFNPGAGNQCIPGDGAGGTYHWEGANDFCTFPGTGTQFSFFINSNAQSQANFVKVGSGSNGFHSFNIFKDDQHVMYTDGNGNQCRSIYYCLDA